MPLIPFPNVPNAPGVPSVPRSNSAPAAQIASLGILQSILWQSLQLDIKWGIFDIEGNALIDTNFFVQAIGLGQTLSTNSISYGKETKVSDFPVERGGFASYNKVEIAASPSITLCFQGNEQQRSEFLNIIDNACKSLDLYDIVTPEVTYINYNIESYNYQRQSGKGATLLTVELQLKEIREVSAQFSTVSQSEINNPKNATASPQVNNGKVQATTPENSTLNAIKTKFTNLFSGG
jgi:hypothetical protein